MINVIQITDCHIKPTAGATMRGVDVDASLAAVLEHIKAHHWPADLILATGDLVHDDPAAYPRLQAMLEPLATPVYCLPGNHDLPTELAAHYSPCGDGWVRRQSYAQQGGWQFVFLDTSVPGSPGGALATTELELLDQMLHQEPNLPALILLHHHPVPIDSAWLDTQTIANADELFAVLKPHKQVKALSWGHVHQAYTGHYDHYSLFATPATSCQFKPDSADPHIAQDTQPGYRWFHLYPDGRFRTDIERVPLP